MDTQINEGDKSPGAVGWSIKTNTNKLKVWTGQSKYGKEMAKNVYMVRAEYYFPTINDP